MSTSELAPEPEELIAPLDRRLPRVALAGEIAMAHDAAALPAKAVERLAPLADESAPERTADRR